MEIIEKIDAFNGDIYVVKIGDNQFVDVKYVNRDKNQSEFFYIMDLSEGGNIYTEPYEPLNINIDKTRDSEIIDFVRKYVNTFGKDSK